MKRMLSMFLALAMVLSAVPFAALATEAETPVETEPVSVTEPAAEEETVPETEPAEVTEPIPETEPVQKTAPAREVVSAEIPFTVNPLYEGIYTAADFPKIERPEAAAGEAGDHSDLDFWQDQELLYAANYLTVEESTEELKQHMINRDETFTLYFKASTNNYQGHLTQMLLAAVEHTGNPKEGDYLQWHYAGWGGYVDYSWINGECCFTFDAQIAYSTTADQEWELDGAVSALLNTVAAAGKTEYQKVKAVYDYICQNVTYDYANLNDETYLLKHSAYAALVNKTAVCQGYATLFYRMMLEMGIDCRVISGLAEDGTTHAWNIVKIGDVYYNLDATWDAGYDEYYWFLRNTINFPYHYRYMEYATAEFQTDYPMAAEDYTEGTEGVADKYIVIGVCGDEVAFGIDRERNLVIAGTGPMWDYENEIYGDQNDIPPWMLWEDSISNIIIEDGVTTIGNNAFYGMENLTSVTLPDTLIKINFQAFMECEALETIVLPSSLEVIEDGAFHGCSKISKITIPNSVTRIGNDAFLGCMALETVALENGLTYIGRQAFRGTGLTELVIPDSVTTIDGMAFYGCGNLQRVSIGSGLKLIGHYVFGKCNALTEVGLSEGVEEIGSAAFQGCSALEKITIPASVTSVDAFSGCSNLKEITFLGDAPAFGYYAFSGVEATAYYPTGNDTWTEEVRQNYQGTITWVATCLNHDYVSGVTDPSCTENGFTTHTCHCGDSYVTDEVAALGHSVVYAVDAAPTLEAEGALAGTCDRCGEVLKIALPKLNKQDYTLEVLVEPTKEAEGLGKYTWNVTEYGEFTFEAAISNVILGDVNEDDKVTILDLMRLANFFAKGAEINEANADVNGDGRVTILDLMRLANYFAGKAELG